jgi:hypothetical protein
MPGDATHIEGKNLKYSGILYVYHEDYLSLEKIGELAKLAKDKNLVPQFRGSSYSTARWLQARHGE